MKQCTPILTAFFCLGLAFTSKAQDTEIIDFFPYQTGDFWVYSEFSESKQSIVNEVKYSVYAYSTDSVGNYRVFVRIDDNETLRYINYRKDTLGNIFTTFEIGEFKVLQQNITQERDFWVGGALDEKEYGMYTLIERYTYFFEGKEREERNIGYSVSDDTTVAFGFGTRGDIWLEGFGNTVQFSAEGGNSFTMKGAYKGGTAFGDTTFREIIIDTVRTNFFPYRNGDVWVYDVKKASIGEKYKEVRYRAIEDSLDAAGAMWVIAEKNNNGIKDTVYYRLELNGDIYSDDFVGKDALKFKGGRLENGDFWVGGQLNETNFAVYQLRGAGVANPFFNSQEVYEDRSIDFYSTQDTTASFMCCGERTYQEVWVANSGIWIYRDHYLPERDEAWILKGAYKEGLVFGDTTFSIMISKELELEVPTSFKLQQNYPNPFNPATTVQYTVSVPSNLSMVLYSYTGQKIAKVFENKYHTQGVFSVQINENIFGSIASSMMILHVKAGNEVQHIKMMYLK